MTYCSTAVWTLGQSLGPSSLYHCIRTQNAQSKPGEKIPLTVLRALRTKDMKKNVKYYIKVRNLIAVILRVTTMQHRVLNQQQWMNIVEKIKLKLLRRKWDKQRGSSFLDSVCLRWMIPPSHTPCFDPKFSLETFSSSKIASGGFLKTLSFRFPIWTDFPSNSRMAYVSLKLRDVPQKVYQGDVTLVLTYSWLDPLHWGWLTVCTWNQSFVLTLFLKLKYIWHMALYSFNVYINVLIWHINTLSEDCHCNHRITVMSHNYFFLWWK